MLIRDGRSGKDESDSSISKPAELKAEKSRKEEELKLQEEEELQLALALSQSEIEHKKQASKVHTQRTYSSPVKVHSTWCKALISSSDEEFFLGKPNFKSDSI